MGERIKAVHASTLLSTNGFYAFQLPFLGSWFDRLTTNGLT
jgi:hypothetical protein